MSGPPAGTVAAELTWTGERFEPGVRLSIGADGRIERLLRPGDPGPPADAAPARPLPRRALLPGFVDAHSHAFQRGLRGLGETFTGPGGDFWSWREEMYGLVGRIDRDRLFDLSLAAFREMRAAGITAVGEFHYLHHEDPEARDFAFDEVVLAAAAEVPIRIALLVACYAAGGPGRRLEGPQRRFAVDGPEALWRQVDRLAGRLADPSTQSLGAVAHSLRAVSPDAVAALWAEARRRRVPLHVHVEEQRREIEECLAAYGRRPMEILLALAEGPGAAGGAGAPLAGTTAVHCTHTRPGDLARFAEAGGRVCVCPLTEANLGDGIPPLAAALERSPAVAGSLCLGTDSNARISMVEEARWLEYGQRLAGERRGALRDAAGRVAPTLLAAATSGGAAALGLPTGELAAGRPADLLALDLDHPALAGAAPETLLEAFLFGSGDEAVAATAVGGRWIGRPA